MRVGDGPSAAAWQLDSWAATGPGARATDVARSVLAAHASGIDPARVTPQLNLVARMASYWDGTKLLDPGAATSLSDDVFGLLALGAAGAPQSLLDGVAARIRGQQTAAGGWSFSDGATVPNLDMTGAALAALCTAGRRSPDPEVDEGLAFVRGLQDPATGGFGGNSDTAGWVVSGLRACHEDPIGPAWRPAEKDALDFLLSQQLASGGFKWRVSDTTENTLATIDAIRPLGGAAFTADPPARAGGEPRLLPVPDVAPGTLVPMTLVVDFGPAVPIGNPGRVRACAVQAPAGGTIGRAARRRRRLRRRRAAAGGRLLRLDGVVEDPAAGRVWSAAIDGAAPAVEIDRAVPFGGLVELRYGSAPGSGDADAPVVTLAAGDGSGRVRERALDLRIAPHDERSPVERLRVRVRDQRRAGRARAVRSGPLDRAAGSRRRVRRLRRGGRRGPERLGARVCAGHARPRSRRSRGRAARGRQRPGVGAGRDPDHGVARSARAPGDLRARRRALSPGLPSCASPSRAPRAGSARRWPAAPRGRARRSAPAGWPGCAAGA